MNDLKQTLLFKKVYGCLLGGAIGDALGGPVESDPWTPDKIRETYGVVDRYDPNLKFVNKAVEIARREADVFAIQKPLYEALEWGHLFSEATHTLAVALAMFVAAKADFRQTVVGCVMYGRDNDSYASVTGALAGAFQGFEAIPEAWIQPVIDANPETDIIELSLKITELIVQDYERARAACDAVGGLL